MELKFDKDAIKRRFMGWLRDGILILAMWCIWLTREYVINEGIKTVMTGFLIAIICITVFRQEYYVMVDNRALILEKELLELKKRS